MMVCCLLVNFVVLGINLFVLVAACFVLYCLDMGG